MKNKLSDLIAERTRLKKDLAKMPAAVNYQGKLIAKEPSLYLRELDRKIAALQRVSK